MTTLARPRFDAAPAAGAQPAQATAALALLALGIVYGDIGTSPLYAAKETFSPTHGIPLTPANILGGVSAIFWSLMIVVSLKYVVLVLRANNRGEGGIMALLALATGAVRERPRLRAALLSIGVFGAALFYGDAVLTPAISVLSAVEGLEVGTSAFKPYVVPIAVGVLVALFSIQRHGTGVVGVLFGPVCALWFVALAAAGIWNIAKVPAVLAALNPVHALSFATGHGVASFVVLGSVLLAITGAEALYADMGHFGKRAIRVAWFGVVAPALVLNYFGQGALLIARPEGDREPVLPRVPVLGALSDGRARDRRHGDRVAGDDLRRVLDHPAGDPARLPAAHDDPAHVRADDRPDLRAGGELDPARRGVAGGGRLRLLVAARVGLRRRGDGHDARHDACSRSS